MKSPHWDALRTRAAASGAAPDIARRLANLSLAIAMQAEWRNTSRSGPALCEGAIRLSRHPLPSGMVKRSIWKALADELDGMILPEFDAKFADEWVESFQFSGTTRKQLGAFATPSAFAQRLASDMLQGYGHKTDRIPTIVDPACGAGALLIASLNVLAPHVGADRIAVAHNLHGAELDPLAHELCCLLVWLAAGPGASLEQISRNIVHANALTFDWWNRGAAFDAVIMNPPWESLRQVVGNDLDPDGERAATISRLSWQKPGAAGLPMLFSAQGRGDRNLFKAFMELAPHLIGEGGRLGLLVPAAFASDDGMAELRRRYFDQVDVERWTSFENRAKHFPIDSRYKFGLLVGTRSNAGTTHLEALPFCVEPDDTTLSHVRLKRTDLRRIGGRGVMIPELSCQRELSILGVMLADGRPFFDDAHLGHITYKREVDLSLGKTKGAFAPVGKGPVIWSDNRTLEVDGEARVPIVEGRMVAQYDCFQKSWVSGSGRTAEWRENGPAPLSSCCPQYTAPPGPAKVGRIAFCDVTSNTNTRTVLATLVPPTWICGNTAPTLNFQTEEQARAGLAIMNSLIFDWMVRRIVSGLHLNRFYLAALVWPRLKEGDVTMLAALASAIDAATPRSMQGSAPTARARADQCNLRAQVEALVARRYGLSNADVRFMLDPDPALRRGFWRYYAATDGSDTLIGSVLDLLATTTVARAA